MTASVQLASMRGTVISGNVKAAGRQTGDGSFADMVASGISAQKENSGAQTKADRTAAAGTQADGAAGRADAAQKADSAERTPGAEEAMKPSGDNTVSEAGAAEKAAQENAVGAQEAQETSGIPEEDAQPAEGLNELLNAVGTLWTQKLSELKQSVMDTLDISEEELTRLLEQIGADLTGLVQPQILQQLVVQAEGNGDPAVLLTSESAMKDLKALIAEAQELTADMPAAAQAMRTEPARLFDEGSVQGEENAAEPSGENSGSAGNGVQAASDDGGETGFSFEAVRQGAGTGKTQENLTDGRGEGQNAAAGQNGMAEQFLNLVTEAAGDEETVFGQLSRAEQVRAVAEQILDKVRVVVGDTQSSMEISLTPESLGKVTLNLVSRQGALTAHFTAENQIAKEAIESQIVVLRENLETQGLKVEAIEVTVSNFDFMRGGGDGMADGGTQENRQRRGRGVTFEEAVRAESAAEAEAIAADMLERSGNQVDYTA